MTSRTKKFLIFMAITFFIAVWVGIFSLVSPEEVVLRLGIENSYLIIFLIAVFGGVSSVTVAPFYAALTTFAAGGVDIILLGIVSGIGLAISDSVFYYFGTKGREMISPEMQRREAKLSDWFEGKPDWVLPVLIFAWGGFTPFPNDIMTVSLAFLQYPYKKLIVPLLIGDITSSILIAYLGMKGILLFS